MTKRWRLVGVAVLGILMLVIAAVSGFVIGWSVRDAAVSSNGDWGKSAATLVAWSGDAWKVGLGAAIAGIAGFAVGWMDRSEKRVDRLEEEKVRFADRIREVSAEMLAIARQYTSACVLYVNGNYQEPPLLPERFGQTVQELRLIVRLQVTYEAARSFFLAVSELSYDVGGIQAMRGGESGQQAFAEHMRKYRRTGTAVTDAVRAELGRPNVVREPESE